MAEQNYTGLPYTSLINKVTPASVYHIDAEGLKDNFNALADGTAIQDQKITQRMLSPEVKDLVTYGIYGAVQYYSNLPNADAYENKTIFIVDEDEGVNEAGYYQTNGVDTWTKIAEKTNEFLNVTDSPGSYSGQSDKIVKVKTTEDGLEFIDETKTFKDLTDTPASYSGNQGKVPAVNSAQTGLEFVNLPAGGSGGFANPVRPAGSFFYPASNPAPLNTRIGTNGQIKEQLFDDTTEEFLLMDFEAPANLDASGTVTFIIWGLPVTWVTGKNVQFKIYHSPAGNTESWDQAYSSKSSGDLAINTVGQESIDRFTFTETVSNLGWTAGDLVRIKLSRIAPTVNNLVGDYALRSFLIDIPRS